MLAGDINSLNLLVSVISGIFHTNVCAVLLLFIIRYFVLNEFSLPLGV